MPEAFGHKGIMAIRFLILASAALTTACAPSSSVPATAPVTDPPAAPVPTAPTIKQPQDKWTDWPIAPGDWVYRRDARGSIALFGAAQADALVTLRCDRQRRRIYLARRSDAASDQVSIRTSASFKNFSASTTGGTSPYLAVELTPNDPILDAISYSRGRFALQTTVTESVAIPVWSEVSRVIEDCR